MTTRNWMRWASMASCVLTVVGTAACGDDGGGSTGVDAAGGSGGNGGNMEGGSTGVGAAGGGGGATLPQKATAPLELNNASGHVEGNGYRLTFQLGRAFHQRPATGGDVELVGAAPSNATLNTN